MPNLTDLLSPLVGEPVTMAFAWQRVTTVGKMLSIRGAQLNNRC